MLHRLLPCVLGFVCALAVTAAPAENDVKTFGAIGDGKADDTAALQRAVDAGRGGVRLGKGVYRVTAPIVIDLDKVGFTSIIGDGAAQVVMAGPGPAFRFVGTHQGSAAPKDFKTNVWERQRGPLVDGIEIVGAHPEADGIEATGTMQLIITKTTIREARHGIHLTVRNRNVIISDCHIYHNRGIGVFYDQVDLHQSNIIGCYISYNAGGGVVSRGGGVRNLHIGTSDLESNMTPDTPPTANVLLDCTGGSTAEVAITGCTIQHNHLSPGSANIRFLGRVEERGKEFKSDTTQWGHLTITGNVLSDVQVNVHLKHARGVTITGNTFGVGFEHDLLVEESSNIVVGPNSFDQNPRYLSGDGATANGGLVFKDSRDCTLTGLHVTGVRRKPGAIMLERCESFHLADCSILDSDGAGLLLDNVTNTRLAGCVVRDRRAEKSTAPSLRLTGGRGNWITQNLLANGQEISEGAARVEGNWKGE